MLTARRVALLVVAVLGYYLFVVGDRGITLVRSGRPALVGLGIGVLLLPLVGVWFVVVEVRFGRASERLARELDTAGERVMDEPRRTPSGRIDRGSADEVFARRKADV